MGLSITRSRLTHSRFGHSTIVGAVSPFSHDCAGLSHSIVPAPSFLLAEITDLCERIRGTQYPTEIGLQSRQFLAAGLALRQQSEMAITERDGQRFTLNLLIQPDGCRKLRKSNQCICVYSSPLSYGTDARQWTEQIGLSNHLQS